MDTISIRKILTLLIALLCLAPPLWAAQEDELMQLKVEVLNHFTKKERNLYFKASEDLKAASLKAGDERLFYRTWGDQGLFEATLQNYQPALQIAEKVKNYARENGSIYGEYAALHAKAMILLQKQDYAAAEAAFLEAVDFHHQHFPNESAGADLQELMKIANHRKDGKAAVKYARQIVEEPNVAPIHKGRALYRLSQMAFSKNDTEEFNRIYEEMMKLKESDGISTLRPLVEVNHCIINGQFEEALRLADELEEDLKYERKAIAYHRMGDDANAYKYLMLYKKVNDSITLVSHGNMVANCYVQMNNERMQMEQYMLQEKNRQLRNRFYATFAALMLMVLLFFFWRSRRLVRELTQDNKQLVYERKDAERALNELNELSFFESRTELDLTASLNVNQMCNRLADYAQNHCYKGVTMLFQTEFPDDFEIRSNPEALRKLLLHLVNYSARFTRKGYIKLACADDGDNILFSVTDTSAGLGGDSNSNLIGMFSEQGNKIRYVGMNFNICQSISRLLHGRIWHDVKYDHGTRFCFELPKVPQTEERAA